MEKILEDERISNYFKRILDHIVQGILFIDFRGVVTTYNKTAEAMLGVSQEQVLFHPFWNHFSDTLFGFSLRDALKNRGENHTPCCITYGSPETHSYELEILTSFLQASPEDNQLQNDSELSSGLLVMLRDVTEIKQLQTMANRIDRMKELGAMAAQVAHEIRNPLGGIKGFATLLHRDLQAHPQLQEMAAHIVEGTDALSQRVSQVLQYARPVSLHPEKVDLVALLKEVKELILADTSIDTSRLTIVIPSNKEQIPIELDIALFKSAILNLMVNAIQAMPEGGEITMSVQKKLKHVALIFSDTGTGISEENLSKIYSPFFTTKPEGNGLGLAEVQKVIQAHHGTIDTFSQIGKGTTFVIKLPF